MSENQEQMSQEEQGARVSSEQIQSLQVLIQAVNVAQQRGAFKLEEAEVVSQAVRRFVVKKEESEGSEESSSDSTPEVV